MKDHKHKSGFLFPLPLVMLLAIVLTPLAGAEVYKTVDKDGNVVYTDQRPNADAQPVELPGLSIISPQEPTMQSPAARKRAEAVAVEGQPGQEVTSLRDLRKGYQDFAIIHPTQDQEFAGTGNEISGVAWDTRFALQEGMLVTVYLDGVAQEPTSSPVVNVGRLDRGTHEVSAELRDRRNRRIATAAPVTFHVRQHSVNFPVNR